MMAERGGRCPSIPLAGWYGVGKSGALLQRAATPLTGDGVPPSRGSARPEWLPIALKRCVFPMAERLLGRLGCEPHPGPQTWKLWSTPRVPLGHRHLLHRSMSS